MASEGFFGGLAGGISDAQTQMLAQQRQQAEQEAALRANAQKQINDTLAHIRETAKAAADAGNDPKSILEAVTPLVQSAQGLAQAAGIDPSMVAQQAQLAVMRPISTPEKKHTVVKIGSENGNDRYGVLEQNSGAITPIGNGSTPVVPASGQPQITAAPTSPANPTPTPAPPASTIAPVSSNGSGIPAMPVQQVAMRFPNPSTAPDNNTPPTPQTPTLPPGMQPGSQAEDYAIKNGITGPEFAKTLSPKEAEGVDAVTKYKIDPSKLSKRIAKGQTESEYTRTLRRAIQADPNYDPKWYPVMQKTLTEFTTGGTTSPASKITNGNTAIQHLGEIADATDKMAAVPGLLDKIAKSNTSIASYAANRLKNEAVRGTSEGQALAAFLTARNRYAEEITAFYAGSQGADADRQRTIDTLDAAKSPQELYSAMNTEGHLLNSKVNALQDRWKNGMSGPRGLGDVMIRNAIPDFPILSDQSKQSLDRISQGLLKTHGVPASQNPNDPLGILNK